jgi:hypothetical protein
MPLKAPDYSQTPDVLIALQGSGPVEVRLAEDGQSARLVVQTAQGPISIRIDRDSLETLDEALSQHLQLAMTEPKYFN